MENLGGQVHQIQPEKAEPKGVNLLSSSLLSSPSGISYEARKQGLVCRYKAFEWWQLVRGKAHGAEGKGLTLTHEVGESGVCVHLCQCQAIGNGRSGRDLLKMESNFSLSCLKNPLLLLEIHLRALGSDS